MQHMVSKLVCLATVAGLGFGAMAALLPTGDYVKDGLVAHWDAIDNVATGTHDPTAAKWVDKVGGVELAGAFTVGETTMVPSADITGTVTGLWELDGYTVETLSYRTDGKGLANSGFITTPRISMGYTSNGPDTFCVSLGSANNVSWMRYYFGTDKPKQHGLATRTASYVVGAAKASGQPVFYYNGVETASSSLEGWTGTRTQNNDVTVRQGTTYHSVRIYNRILSAEEIAYNSAVDQKRFVGNDGPISQYSRFVVQPIPGQRFCGRAIVPEVQVSLATEDGLVPLEKGVDYTVVCTDNVAVGEAKLKIVGSGTYANEIPFETTFDVIAPAALPEGYVPLKYIESTGSQCIDTRVSGMAVHGFEIGLQPTSLQAAGQQFVASVYNRNWLSTYSSDLTKLQLAVRGSTLTSGGVVDLGRLNDVAVTNGVFTINGARVCDAPGAFASAGGNVFLFNNSTYNNSNNKRPARGRCSYFRAYDVNGILLCDLVPAKRDADEMVGLYDRISGDFLVDKAGGNFTAGEEYSAGRIAIVSVGGGATAAGGADDLPLVTNLTGAAVAPEIRFVDLVDHTTNVATAADFDFVWTDNVSNGVADVSIAGKTGGAWAGESARARFAVYAPRAIPSDYQRVEYIRGTGSQYLDTTYVPGVMTTLVMDYNGGDYIHNSGVFQANAGGWLLQESSGTYKWSSTSLSLAPWGANSILTITPGGVDNFTLEQGGTMSVKSVGLDNSGGALMLFYAQNINKGRLTVRRLELYENGVPKREFHPVYRLSDGKTGLYDVLTGVFSSNLGTGEFQLGHGLDGNFAVAEVPAQVYRGGATLPEPTVTDPATGNPLVKGVDYELEYEDCGGPGTGRVYAKGIGSYHGEIVQEFAIDTLGVLPEGYVQLEYVESSGTQWFGTETAGTTTDLWSYRLDAAITPDGGYSGVDGGIQIIANATYGADGTRHIHRVDVTNTTETIYCDNLRMTTAASGNQAGKCIVVLARMKNNSNTIEGVTKISGRIYGFELLKNGRQVCFCVPARREADGAIGLFDFAALRFRTNYGTGVFAAGPEVATPRLRVVPIPEQTIRGRAGRASLPTEATPEVRFVDPATGATNVATAADFEITYVNNASNGLGQVVLVGRPGGAYAGETTTAYFPIRYNADSIPRDYQQVDSLRIVGAQTINTGFFPCTDTELTFDYYVEKYAANQGHFSAGTWGAGYSSGQIAIAGNNTGHYTVLGDYQVRTLGLSATNLVVTRNGTATAYTGNLYNIATTAFQTSFGAGYTVRLKKLVFRDAGVLKHEFYPVFRASDDVLGLYDIVTGKFIVNTGAGTSSYNYIVGNDVRCTFEVEDIPPLPYTGGAVRPEPVVKDVATGKPLVKGEDYTVEYRNAEAAGRARVYVTGFGENVGTYYVEYDIVRAPGLPPGYTELEYIESSGTQYLSTDMKASAGDAWSYRLDAAITPNNGYSGCVGLYFYANSLYGADGQRHFHQLDCDAEGAGVVFRDFDKMTDVTVAGHDGLFLPVLAYAKTATGYDNKTGLTSARVYGFQLVKNGELVSFCVPARRDADGTVGLYDFAQARLHTNCGSGSFAAGPEVPAGRLAALPIAEQVATGAAIEPAVTLHDRETGTDFAASADDFDIVYARNVSNGLARVTLSGKPGGAYAGESVSAYFAIRVPANAIPDAYQRVDALKSVGTQRLAMDIWACTDSEITFDMYVESSENKKGLFSFGTWSMSRDSTWSFNPGNKTVISAPSGNVTLKTLATATDNFIFVLQSGVNVSTRSVVNTAGGFTSIFDGATKVSLKSLTMRDSGVLKHELYPVYRKADGVTGFYDIVSGQFATNYNGGADYRFNEVIGCDIAVDDVQAQLYEGGASTPPPVVKDSATGRLLEKDVDYTVEYVNNESVGTARLFVRGRGAYTGVIFKDFRITPAIFASPTGAAGNTGESWDSPLTVDAAIAKGIAAYNAGSAGIIWIKSGTVSGLAQQAITVPLRIVGGFRGAGGTSDEVDAERPYTTFDANLASGIKAQFYDTANADGYETQLERIEMRRAYEHGYQKAAGVSGLSFRDCRFIENAGGNSQLYGRGLNAIGSKRGDLTMSNCVFEANCTVGVSMSGAGFALYTTGFRRTVLDDCHFATNGICCSNGRQGEDCVVYVGDTPLLCRNSTFRGSVMGASGRGAGVYLVGACGGSAFTNCLFAGHASFWGGTYTVQSICGAVAVNLSDVDDTVDFDHCTFAYNLNGSCHYYSAGGNNQWANYSTAAGLHVHSGAVKVRNSIFWGNSVSSDSTAPADLFVYHGSADVDHTIFGGMTYDYFKASPGGGVTLSVGEHVFSADPHFVTSLADLAPHYAGTLGGARGSLNLSKHRWNADSAAVDALGTIDVRFDPDYADSTPAYYYGCHGAAADAVPATHGTPALAAADVEVTFPDGLTAPRVAFTLGGTDVPFNAEAVVKVEAGGETLVENAVPGLVKGSAFAWTANCCPEPGAALTVTVTVKSPGCDDVVVAKSASAEGVKPRWAGHGGDPAKVVHVRVGSTAVNPQGTSWEDAYPDFRPALGIAGGERDEVWVAGDFSYEQTPLLILGCGEIKVRGGFDGSEDGPEERGEGTYTTLDGQRLATPFQIQSPTAITFERFRFTRGNAYGFYRRESSGAVTFVDCLFDDNVCQNAGANYTGCGFYSAQGAKGLHGDIAFYGTRFEGNGRGDAASSKYVYGAAIYVRNETSLTVDGCTFVTNGCAFGVANDVAASSPVTGSAIYDEGTPVAISNSRFVGNRASGLKTTYPGGTVYLAGGITAGSIANCAFVGNETVHCSGSAADAGTMAATVVVNYSEPVRTLDLSNCTFAWNLTSGSACPVDLFVNAGTATLRNSIFHGGATGSENAGAEGEAKYVKTGGSGSLATSYTMFDGAPSFVTDDPLAAVLEGDTVRARWEADAAERFLAADVHLLSPRGYCDNAGVWHENTDVAYSKAIDAGDPADAVGAEPQPNGGFVNLGCYGGTAEASMTKEVLPVIVDDAVEVTFPNGTTLPRVAFALEPGEEYTASVRIYTGTNGIYSTVSPALPALPGQSFSWLSTLEPYWPGDTVNVKVVITCGSQEVVKEVTATAEGEMPGWFGTGGGEGVIHVWADAPGDRSGKDWRNAMATLADALAAYTADVKAIWMTGDENLTNSFALTALGPVAVVGGFSACENSPAERVKGRRSLLNAGMAWNTMTLVNEPERPVTLDGFDYHMAINHGVMKTGGGDLGVFNCTFLTNGTMSMVSPYNGRGLYVSAPGAKVVVSNCLFAANRLQTSVNPGTGSYDSKLGQGAGSGAYFTGCASVTVEQSDFLWNGIPYIEANAGAHTGNPQCGGFSGSAIYSNVPTTLRGCRFLGNSETVNGTAGGTVRLEGTATGVVERCLFAGNFGRYMGESSGAGALVLNLANPAYRVDVDRCTFACNLADARKASAGLTVMSADVELCNSVFVGNMLGTIALDTGADLNVQAGSSCRVSYTVFASTNEADSVAVAAGASCEMGAGVVRGDPLIVTEGFALTNTAYFAWNSGKYPYYRNTAETYAAAASIDAHLRSSEGYFTNDGARHKAEDGVLSPAIDAGDPYVVCTEPEPNGGRMNAGFYGNTAEASASPYGDPQLEDDPVVTFPDEYSIPTVTFIVGGEGVFSAEATVYLTTNGVDWAQIGIPVTGLTLGQEVVHQLPIYLLPGSVAKVRVELRGAGKVHEYVSAEKTVDKPGPHWWGKGGDPARIVHCRPGAIASKGDGTSWTDAATDIASALKLMTAERNEIWISGTDVLSGAMSVQKIAYPFAVRGGFTAAENSAAERPDGTWATLDGGFKYDVFSLENADTALFERVAFSGANEHNFKKTGAGDLVFEGCRFAHCRTVGSYSGRGGHFTGTAETTLTFRNCVVEGNNPTGLNGNVNGTGMGLYITTFRRVFIDDTLFVTNGNMIGGVSASNQSAGIAAGIYAVAAPLTIRGTRFIGHSRGSENGNGGVVYLGAGCGGSALTNCLFAGNEDWNNNIYGAPSTVAPLMVAMADASDHVDVVNCTFAHNLADGSTNAGGVRVTKGTVDIANSVFYGTIVGKSHQEGGRDVYASGADTTVRIRYSICETNVNFASDGVATLEIGEGVKYDDPLLVTARDELAGQYEDVRRNSGNTRRFRATATPVILAINAHVKGFSGYVDERTGEKVRFGRGFHSPAIDAGDPAVKCVEPKPNGHRVNMGFYGNTPWATMSKHGGALVVK